MRTHLVGSLVLVLSCVVGGCSGTDPGEGQDVSGLPTAPGAEAWSPPPLAEYCKGKFYCERDDSPFPTWDSNYQDGVCTVGFGYADSGEYSIDEAGNAHYSVAEYDVLTHGTWSWTSDGFEMRLPGQGLITCRSEYTKSSDGSSKCQGVSVPCSARPPSSCSSQAGCQQRSHVKWDGSLEFKCEGLATACSALGSEIMCERQSGCSWL